jgi:hypothetical protein
VVDGRNELPVRQVETCVQVNGRPPILRAPVVERRTRNEGYVPDNIYSLCGEANHDALCGQRNPAALLHHDNPVTEIEPLVLKSVNCVLRFEHRPWWDVLHHRTPEILWRHIFVKSIGQFFNLFDYSLWRSSASCLGSARTDKPCLVGHTSRALAQNRERPCSRATCEFLWPSHQDHPQKGRLWRPLPYLCRVSLRQTASGARAYHHRPNREF